jgi:hypothetical protein
MKKGRYIRIDDGPPDRWETLIVFFVVLLTVIHVIVTTPMVIRLLVYFGWY